MYQNATNAIQRARIRSGLTQEALAERSGYSDDSIRAWESGARIASLEALTKLQLALDAPWLTGMYLAEQTENLNGLLPKFQPGRPIAQAAASYIDAVLELVENRFDRKLLKLVADGKIDAAELHVFDEIMELAAAVNQSYYEMRFAQR